MSYQPLLGQKALVTGSSSGIGAGVAIELAKKEFPLEERDVTVDELFAADEVFITGSFKEVVPIVSIDGRAIGDGKAGPVTKRLIGSFREFADKY